MFINKIKQNYLNDLNNKSLIESRLKLFRNLSEKNYKLDRRYIDWIYLLDLKKYNHILVFGSEFSESIIYFQKLFHKVDVIMNNPLDENILRILSKNYSNISLLTIDLIEPSVEYDLVFVDSTYRIDPNDKLFFSKIFHFVRENGILAIIQKNKYFHNPHEFKLLNKSEFSFVNQYAWLPSVSNSPLFVFDVKSYQITKYFLKSMSNIFQSVSPENKRKFNNRILILKIIKILFGIKFLNYLFKKLFPCYLYIYKKC